MRLPDETAGVNAIARTLISAFDQVDIVALGEWHGRIRLNSDLRIALVRHPDFAKKMRSIVVEFGSTSEQSTLDRYIRGENVSRAQLEQVATRLVRGAHASIKPGAQAPGSKPPTTIEPAKRAIELQNRDR